MPGDKQRHTDHLAEERLELIPRGVRDKLDRVGFKVHLSEWQAISMPERERLREWPCDSTEEVAAYAAEVERLVRGVAGKGPDKIQPKATS
jgi:hypothetical protein